MLLEESLDPVRDLGVLELGHGGEEMVLDLEVKVRHPPGADVTWVYVDGMDSGVLDPIFPFMCSCDIQTCK